jgi:hypothetical protein
MPNAPIRSASDILAAFMDEELAGKAERASGFFRSWKQVVGERLSAHSRVAELERGIVIVEADHPSWIQLLQLRQEEILGSIKRGWPELQVRGVAFRLGTGNAAGKKTDPAIPVQRDETESPEDATAAEKDNSAPSMAKIKDERLKSALERLRKSAKRRGSPP